MNQPVVPPRDGTTNGKDARWPKVTGPPKKKKTPHGQGTRTGRITSLGIMNQLVTGHPPVPPPEPADMQHPPFTPAHEAIIGPKHPNLT